MRLLLDLGNTRIKWGLVDTDGSVTGMAAHEWDAALATRLRQAWETLPCPQGIWAASVVDAAREAQVVATLPQNFPAVNWVRTPSQGGGVRVAYADPQTLGVDRFLTMVAAHAAKQAPCVLASAGTAMVLDALSGDGRHLGGLIAPGARLMQQSVLDATARVRPQSPGDVAMVASNTADALASGCWQACAALVDRFVVRMADTLGGAPTLLLGGGDAEALARLIDYPVTLHPDAVLKGLAAWSEGAS
ncbi:MAG TPA: type III pantothenate kinase [Oleiagrimonas sp.]|nr:type III pantothenate kinase [Oleiagrimonas sp.]